jgi:hypothetical protein
MGIKSDKTFEEIVERIVALFTPQPEKRDASAQPHPPASETHATTPPRSTSRVAKDETD